MELDVEVREFLIECNENLGNLDQEIILLEQQPENKKLISSVFRTIHTIKGTCGFFGFGVLNGLTHVAENILDQVRSSTRTITPALSALLLETVDAIKAILLEIEQTGEEGDDVYGLLRQRLEEAHRAPSQAVSPGEERYEQMAHPAQLPDVANLVVMPAAVAAAAPTLRPVEPAPSSDPAGAQSPEARSSAVDSSIRVDVDLLDKLMNLVGELVLARNQLLQGASGGDGVLLRSVQRLNVITSELQENVLKTRMQPIGVVWNKLPRVVHDLAVMCGKQIRLEMEGVGTELDKTIIEAIKDPLTHIVRNACDHGVEAARDRVLAGKGPEGLITLRAYHEGGHVKIEILDDGRGLDTEKIKARAISKGLLSAEQAGTMTEAEAIHLLFAPGFSTAETVSTISGRGVGMDVVKTNIQKIGGIVDIGNRPGTSGTIVRITIPLTLAIIPGLIVRAAISTASSECPDEHRFVIPQASLVELIRLERDEERRQVEYVNGHPVLRRRGQLLPLTYLNRLLKIGDMPTVEPGVVNGVVNIVVVQAEGRPFGLIVDGISDTQEIVVKPLGKRLKTLSAYLGATIMGDGRIALILDIPGLSYLAGMASQAREIRRHEPAAISTAKVKQSFLIFQAARFKRVAVPLGLVARLEQISGRSIELAAGKPVLHYRGEILSLLELASVLDTEHAPSLVFPDTVQVVVLGDDSRRFGVIVDCIVDIVEEEITFRKTSVHPGLIGSALLGDAVTDLLDVEGLMDRALPARTDPVAASARVLLYEPSRLARTLRRSVLEVHGYLVEEADTMELAEQLLSSSKPDLLLLAWADDGRRIVEAARASTHEERLPVIVMMESAIAGAALPAEVDAVVSSHDREAMLRALAKVSPQPMKALNLNVNLKRSA